MMRSDVLLALTGALATALVWVMLGTAHAAEGEPGSFTWTPSLKLASIVNDNVDYEKGAGDGAPGMRVRPRLELAYRIMGLELGADLGADIHQYSQAYHQASDQFYRAIGWAELGLAPGLRLRFSNALTPYPLRQGRPTDEAANMVQTNRTELDLRWWHELSNDQEIELGAQAAYFWSEKFSERVPQNGGGFVLDGNFHANYWQGLLFAELQMPVASRTAGYIRGQVSYRSLKEDSDADHLNISLVAGVRSNILPKLDLDLSGGVGLLSFEGLDDKLRALARLDLRYQLDSGWSTVLEAHHLFSVDLIGRDVLESSARIAIEKRFGTATAVELGTFITRFEVDSISSDPDIFGGAEIKLRRQLTRIFQVGLSYRHWWNRGTFGSNDFSQNRVVLELSVRL